jgi:peptide/nickel transport system substrate-binding protein
MKKYLIVLLAACLLFTLASCSGKKDAESTIVYGTTEKVSDMDTANAYDFHTWEIFQNVFIGLTTYTPGTTDLVPGLAESWKTNDKGDEYTFTLRDGLKFSNGDALDAAAVKWSIERVMKLKGDPSWLITDFVTSVEAPDAKTVVFKLKGPTAFFPALVATPTYFPVDPKVFPADKIIKDPSELTGGSLVGDGPYNVKSFKRDEEVVLVANPDYFGGKAPVSRIIIKYFADASTLRLAFEKGEIDLAFKQLNPSDVADLTKKSEYKTFQLPGPQIRYISFETSQSVFKDKTLRQAIAALVDRSEINEKVYLGQNAPLYSMIPNGMTGQVNTFKDADLATAEALLKKAGYSEAKPLDFELWYTPSHYGDAEVNFAEVLKAQFEKTKLIKVTLKNAEWSTYKEQWNKKQMSIFLLGWYPDYIDPDDYTAAFAGTSGSAGNGIYFSNKEWDALFAKEQSTSDAVARDAIFKDVQERWVDEVPTIPVWQGNLYVFTKPSIDGVKIGPTLIFNYNQLSLTSK